MKEHLEKIKSRVIVIRQGGIEISPSVELIILKEAELAWKCGGIEVLEKYNEMFTNIK